MPARPADHKDFLIAILEEDGLTPVARWAMW
jgi:hypothetical protein